MSDKRGFSRFLGGFAFGLVAGAVAGILLADRPGHQLRQDIKMGSSEALNNLRHRLEEIKEQATERFHDFKDFADEKLRKSALNMQEQVAHLNKQLQELGDSQKKS